MLLLRISIILTQCFIWIVEIVDQVRTAKVKPQGSETIFIKLDIDMIKILPTCIIISIKEGSTISIIGEKDLEFQFNICSDFDLKSPIYLFFIKIIKLRIFIAIYKIYIKYYQSIMSGSIKKSVLRYIQCPLGGLHTG